MWFPEREQNYRNHATLTLTPPFRSKREAQKKKNNMK